MTRNDPYGSDILKGHARRRKPAYPEVQAEPGIVVEVVGSDFVGAVIAFDRTHDGDFVRLEDRRGTQRLFKMLPGAFEVEGRRVTLTRAVAEQQAPAVSNSGSRRVEGVRAKVAMPSRIWVEGILVAAIVE